MDFVNDLDSSTEVFLDKDFGFVLDLFTYSL